MKNHSISIWQIFFSILFIALSINLKAQAYDEDFDSLKIKNYEEKLFIHTDRDIYISGEKVWLKAYKINGLTGFPSDMSKVVYVELLDSLNNPVTQIKIWVTGSSGSSVIKLSDTLSTGNYLIRGYTKWMLNYSEDLFFYKTISVINPFKSIEQLMDRPKGKTAGNDLLIQTEAVPSKGLNAPGNSNSLTITAKLNKVRYLPRDKAVLDITVTDQSGNPVKADMSVSVVKSFLYNKKGNQPGNYFTLPFTDYIDSTKTIIPSHLPEIEGPLLSGTIKNKLTNEPLKNIDISLSVVGKTARCQFVKTNDKGEFNFVLREQYDLNEVVIQPLSSDISDSYVELNQLFCNTFNENKAGVLYLDSAESSAINNAIIGMQVSNIYEPFRQQKKVVSSGPLKGDFYGKPDRRIKMSDYIELRNVREIVKEILPDMMLVKKFKKVSLKITNSYPYQPFENQALILIDGVPVYDLENLLNVSSKELEKIDVIYRRYFFSDYIFDGLVSFTTKKGDMSALESDKTGYRQVFEGYRPAYNFYVPDYSIDSLKQSHIPDFRNTLCWKPDLESAKEGNATVEFYTSDESGIYNITIEGISSKGERGVYNNTLIIK